MFPLKRKNDSPGSDRNQRVKIREENEQEFGINTLPKPILAIILSNTGYRSMFNVKLVCKRWYEVSETDVFYMGMLRDYVRPRLEKFCIKEEQYLYKGKFGLEEKSWKEIFLSKREIKTKEETSNNNMENNGEMKKNKEKVFATKYMETGAGFYEGELVDGMMCGLGMLYKQKEGLIYVGEFDDDIVSGYGERMWANGDKFVGNYVKTKKQGKGMLLQNGILYEGEFKDDLKHGYGKIRMRDGTTYEGEWANGKTNGKGTLKSKTAVFTGNWEDGKKSGYGEMTTNTYTYKGQWSLNEMNGKGVLEQAIGHRYEGEFKNGKYHGKGEFTTRGSAFSFKGQFKNHLPHGPMTVTLDNYYSFVGKFKKGKKHGPGKIIDPSGEPWLEVCYDMDVLQSCKLANTDTDFDMSDLSIDLTYFRDPEKCD